MLLSGRIATLVLAAGGLAGAACAEIPEPGVRVGAAFVERTLVCEPLGIGSIQNIVRLPIVPDDGGGIWVGGEQGCVRLSPDGVVRAQVRFERRAVDPVPIDVEQDGTWETMDRGEGWSAVGLLDAAGHPLWAYPPGRSMFHAPDAMAAGAVGEGGTLGFVVGMNGADGVRLLDRDGQLTTSIAASNVFSVAVTDLDGDGQVEILHSDATGLGGRIWVRDYDGCPVRRIDVGFDEFSLVRWPEPSSPPRLLGVESGDALEIVDPCAEPRGERLVRYLLPDVGFADAEGALVRPAPGAAPCLAVVRTIRGTWRRSALYVFDAERTLVYHEVFDVPDLGLAVVPAGATGASDDRSRAADVLLVGAGSRVWRYELLPLPLPRSQSLPDSQAPSRPAS